MDDKSCGVTAEGFREAELRAALAASLSEPSTHPEVVVIDDVVEDDIAKAIQLSLAEAAWLCPDCTFRNQGTLLSCDMCGFVK